MTEWLLNFLGVWTDASTRIADVDLALRGQGSTWWVLPLALVAVVGAFWSYRTLVFVPRRRQWLLAGLRALALLLLIGMLLRPVLQLTIEGDVRRAVLVLLDASASMQIEDPRTDEADIKRAMLASGRLDAQRGLDQPLPTDSTSDILKTSRRQVVVDALGNQQLALISRLARTYDLRPYAFGQKLTDLPTVAAGDVDAAAIAQQWTTAISSAEPLTPLGDALRDALGRSRGQPLAGVVVITDGQSNSGAQPVSGAEAARAQGVPVFTWGVGITSPRDVVVASVLAPEVGFIRDEVSVLVRVRGQGLAGQTARLVLRQNDKPVAETDVRFESDREQVVPMKFTPQEAGDVELRASIEARGDEAVRDNNSAAAPMRVIDRKIKVLMVEQAPRWEFQYLQAILLRDRRVELKCVLLEADPSIARIESSPYLERFPQSKADLLEYDLLILGDVDPRALSSQQVQWIGEHVSQFGGGLLWIAGRRFGPGAFAGSVLEKMLPVELAPQRASARNGDGENDKPISVELTAAGLRSTMLRLADTDDANRRAWSEFPPIYWTAPVERLKPAAEALLVHPDPALASADGKKMPIFALQQYGVGQVLFAATDNTWRWRKNEGEKRHRQLWGQIVQRLALPHLLGESKRTQLTSDKRLYSGGERVTVFARLYNDAFEPVSAAQVRATYKINGAGAGEVVLRPIAQQPGLYQGEFVAAAAGKYVLTVDGDESSALELSVTPPRLELGETALNEAGLREVATISGGTFLREEDLVRLPELIRQRSQSVQTRRDVDLWSSPAYFLLVLALFSAEWAVRKMSQLK